MGALVFILVEVQRVVTHSSHRSNWDGVILTIEAVGQLSLCLDQFTAGEP